MIESAAEATARTEIEDAAGIVKQIAHELRQPLSTIESIAYYLDLILPRDDVRARKQLGRLQGLVEQSNWIVSNAVHYMQASTPVPQYLDLAELLTSAASESALEPTPLMEFGEPAALVRLDPGQALHLFRNLLTFFRNIGLPGEEVRVTAWKVAEAISIRFHSTVPGYELCDVESLFVPFSPSLPAGSGLSLASVRRIVEAHDGQIDIDADNETGVSITITFPG